MNFWRNGWVSLATIFVMVQTLFVIGALIFANVLLTSSLSRLEDKLDISIYFKVDAEEKDILEFKENFEKMPEVERLEYISKDEALRKFMETYRDNSLVTQSFEILGENPLPANINLKAKDPRQYSSVSRLLEAPAYENLVDKVTYNQKAIGELTNLLGASRTLGLAITIFLVASSILVAFNTIRLAIYTARDEISIMRLVGASNFYIRGPFLVEGIIHGLISSVLATVIFWPLVIWLGPKSARFFGGLNIYDYYFDNFVPFFLILLGFGVVLGVISSLIATRRYLRESK